MSKHMHRLGCATALLVSAAHMLSQTPPPTAKIVYNLSPEQIRALQDSRTLAQREVFRDPDQYATPDIARLLGDPSFLIAIATVTSLQVSEPGSGLPTKFSLHVEQLLRGTSEVKDLHAESMFSPPRPQDIGEPMIGGGPRRTILDWNPPKIGTLYVIGYRFLYESGGRAYIPGAIDLSDPAQARILPDVQRFLGIESLAGDVNTGPYIVGLDDPVPWIRDLSARHLIQSDTCNATPSCVDALLSAIRQLLPSKKPTDRLEALELLSPFTQPSGGRKLGQNGQPVITPMATAMREMLASAVSDSNLFLGDKAYDELQLYDFYHSALPDECIQTVPVLRKSTRWAPDETKPESFGGPFGGTSGCIPKQ